MRYKWLNPMQRSLRWLFFTPLESVRPKFGDPAWSDVRLFEIEAEELDHRPWGRVSPALPGHHGGWTKPL